MFKKPVKRELVSSKLEYCRLCLAKQDLIELTSDKQNSIQNILDITLSQSILYRLCTNCSKALACLEKFKRNCLKADNILRYGKDSILRNSFLSCVTDESLSSAFDIVQNWLGDVGFVLRHLDDVLFEKGIKVEQSLEDYHDSEMEVETLHEEEVFAVEGTDDEPQTKTEIENTENILETCSWSDADDEDFKYEDYDDDEDDDDSMALDVKKIECTDCGIAYLKSNSRKHKCEQKSPLEKKPYLNISDVKDEDEVLDPYELERLSDENFNVEEYYDESQKGKKRIYLCRICHRHYMRSEFIYHRNKHLSKLRSMLLQRLRFHCIFPFS